MKRGNLISAVTAFVACLSIVSADAVGAVKAADVRMPLNLYSKGVVSDAVEPTETSTAKGKLFSKPDAAWTKKPAKAVKNADIEGEGTETAKWYGVDFAYPNKWKKAKGTVGTTWTGTWHANTPIYYTAYADMKYDGEATYKDMPKVLSEAVTLAIQDKFACYRVGNYEYTVNNTEEVTVGDSTFIKEVGEVSTKKDKVAKRVSYVAYYGLMDFPKRNKENVPVVWVAYANSLDVVVVDDMEHIVAATADNLGK